MVKKLTEEAYTVSSWSGGKTVQLAIAPEGAVYADRDFLWRVSSATVELPESDYTALPDYDRFITPLNGEMILSHDGGEETRVEPFSVHEFDGAARTHCRGTCTDFNLMLRKEKCAGQMFPLELGSENAVMLNPVEENQTVVLYLAEGEATILTVEDEFSVQKGETLLISGEENRTALETETGATFVVACAEIL